MNQQITKQNLKEKAARMIEQMEEAELVVRGKAMQEIGKEIYDAGKDKMLATEEEFEDKHWNGVKISYRSGRSSYTYHDKELKQLEEEMKELRAKMKARETYLKEAGKEGKDYEIETGKPGIAVYIP